ncbi:MAG: hypothetical protein MR481_05815 [Campylobacter sp.]|uniref:hypothetical protein n=1 Tax=Campylobacter sp. TaxID=205 RepID=UPI002AA904F0|nr:hypothetical protein [Campylobacter sp.]MCI7247422.1 hypothetical protein [Campylobacter sp.]
MLKRLNIKLSKIIIALAVGLSTMFLVGCSSKHEIVTIQKQRAKSDYSKLLSVKRDFSSTASTESEAAAMVWELYLYTKELENALGACVEMGSK